MLGLWVRFWGGRENGVDLGVVMWKEVMGGVFCVVFFCKWGGMVFGLELGLGIVVRGWLGGFGVVGVGGFSCG